ASRIGCNAARRDGDGPEQTVVETGIEVMRLVAKIGGRRPHKEVDSNEGEYSLTMLSIPGDILPRHEADVRVEYKRRVGRRSNAPAGPASEDVGRAEDTVEIGDRGKLLGCTGQVEMENVAVAEEIEPARNWVGQSVTAGRLSGR